MKDAGILDSDYVVVRSGEVADDGEIVVALIDDEATVKRFYREKDAIRLQPENKAYKPIRSTDAKIVGRVVGVFRTLA
jgi:repressor LexA